MGCISSKRLYRSPLTPRRLSDVIIKQYIEVALNSISLEIRLKHGDKLLTKQIQLLLQNKDTLPAYQNKHINYHIWQEIKKTIITPQNYDLSYYH